MKPLNSFLSICFLFCSFSGVKAQETTSFKASNLKLNLTNLVFKNFDLQYERTLSANWSAAFAVRYMPLGNFPFQSTLERDVNTGNDRSNFDHETFRTGSITITPELRYYFNTEHKRGFYLGAFVRYSNFFSDDFTLNYYRSGGEMSKIALKGDFNTFSGGLIVGKQFKLGERFSLDCFLGGHLGKAKGSINASYETLSNTDQQGLQNLLDGIQLKHLSEKAVHLSVGQTNTRIRIDGPWEAFRGGISLSYWF